MGERVDGGMSEYVQGSESLPGVVIYLVFAVLKQCTIISPKLHIHIDCKWVMVIET